jgi:hypothetical protein
MKRKRLFPGSWKGCAVAKKIKITKHGVTVAVLQPPVNAIRKLRMFRERHSLKGITLREMIEEGRR